MGFQPPPKPAGERRRRNKPAPTVELTEKRSGGVPDAPKGLSPAGRAWWRRVWRSPVASGWLDVDFPVVVRLARLLDRIEVDADGGYRALAEARALEDRLGLSPLARQRMSWKAPEAGAAKPAASAGERDSRILRALEGGRGA